MKKKQCPSITVSNETITVNSFSTVIIGSGAAGLNCAVHLYDLGTRDICIVTEGINRGTSRNSGSDKQTYYKLNVGGAEADSARNMAQALFEGGATDGDTALCEAALSWKEFAHLLEIGVPFPHNRWGEYTGYRTDHDTAGRGSSAGPLTSRIMTECLEREARSRSIPIHDRTRVIKLLVSDTEDGPAAAGILAIVRDHKGFHLAAYRCRNIVYAAGGPAGIYKRSVYPLSQGGGTGAALAAGALGKNLTESQYGIASLTFRWNLSGTYQQVLPAYVSEDPESGEEKEFLADYFPDTAAMLAAQFLKGYQWPFTPSRITDFGSSLIDIAVYHESVVRERNVFLDYTRNPGFSDNRDTLDAALLSEEAHSYLANSEALFGTPVDRLITMNEPAYELYLSHNIDLKKEKLEIGVCAQHNNGGIEGNAWWESNIAGLFPVGEVNGSHGVYRPGGAALNAGQTGGLRAAEYIHHTRNRADRKPPSDSEIGDMSTEAAEIFRRSKEVEESTIDPQREIEEIRERMDRSGSIIREEETVKKALVQARDQLSRLENAQIAQKDLLKYYILMDHSITQIAYLEAIREYIARGGISRGSYLILDDTGTIPCTGLEQYRFRSGNDPFSSQICNVHVSPGLKVSCSWRNTRPVPPENGWFETVWKEYREGKIYE